MTTEVLGQYNFSEVPLAGGDPLMLNSGGVPAFLAGSTLDLPLPGTGPEGRIYLDTTVNRFYRDDGVSWIDLTPLMLLNGTAGELNVVPGTNVTPSIISLAPNLVMPGTEGFVPPKGATLNRPLAPALGEQRFNTTLERSEEYNGSNWQPTGGGNLQMITGSIGSATGTTTVPLDNTSPLATEGFQIWTTTFTPQSATSRVRVEFVVTGASSSNNNTLIISAFSATTNIGSVAARTGTANTAMNVVFSKTFTPGSTLPITISARMGGANAGTVYCNTVGSITLGGALLTTYTITEYE